MQNRRALIIGIDKYPNLSERAQLEGCVRDAREVAELLERRFGFPRNQMTLLLNEQATRDGILKAMNDLASRVQENDAVVVHYSGHGSQRLARTEDAERASRMEETFVAHDSGHYDPHPNQDVSGAEVQEWIARLTKITPNVTLILDCCHSGTLAAARHDGPVPQGSTRVRGIKADGRQPPESRRFRDAKGPASLIRHVVIAACRDSEYAHEAVIDGKSHGALTWNLLRRLASLPADACPTYREVFEPVRSQVRHDHDGQEPQLEGVGDRELFGLAELIPLRFLPVQDRQGDRILLGGGAASGVAEGSIWIVHPPQARAGAEVLGHVQVVEVRGLTAIARILDEVRPDEIRDGCRAVQQEISRDSAGSADPRRRYQEALGIRNEWSRLQDKVVFDLNRQRAGVWEPLPEGGELEEGERFSFQVVNQYDKPLYIYVLSFGLTGNVSQIYPVHGVSDPLEPGRRIEIGTFLDVLKSSLPEGVPDGGEETLKLFAATRELDLSIHFQAARQGATRGEGRTRDVEVSLDPVRMGDDWITIERRYRLKRRPGGRVPGRVTRSGARSMS